MHILQDPRLYSRIVEQITVSWNIFQNPGICSWKVFQLPEMFSTLLDHIPRSHLRFQHPGRYSRILEYILGSWNIFQAFGVCTWNELQNPGISSRLLEHIPRYWSIFKVSGILGIYSRSEEYIPGCWNRFQDPRRYAKFLEHITRSWNNLFQYPGPHCRLLKYSFMVNSRSLESIQEQKIDSM